VGCCVDSNGPSDSIIYYEILDYLSFCFLVEKGLAPWT
jgi:hypothetical protein